jgi:hypothetical protein
MAIEQVQSAGSTTPSTDSKATPRRQQARVESRIIIRDTYVPGHPPYDPYPGDPFCRPWHHGYPFCNDPFPPTSPPPGGYEPLEVHGSVSANLQVYFNTRTKEPQLLPTIKGNLELSRFGKNDEQGIGVGLSLSGNGLTGIATPMVVGTILDRDYDEDQHLKLDLELGYSMIHDKESWDPGNRASYNALRVGANFAPHKNINITAGADVSGTAVNPYIGLGGRWAF